MVNATMAEPFYVTTPIYYVNDAPHIGHAYTTVAADALARWRRLWGDDVMFLTGTDEHGLKVQRAAEANGSTPREWADRNSERFRAAWAALDITNDDFIRTTEPRHRRAVAGVPPAGLRLRRHRARHVRGPVLRGRASSTTRRTSSSTATARSTARPSSTSPRRTTSSGSRATRTACSSTTPQHPEAVQPEGKRNEVLGLIKQGLQDFSISRTSISWGIPLPWDPTHVAYVWFDALINYCTAVGYPDDRERFDRYWPADYHLIGKDILRSARRLLARDVDGGRARAAEVRVRARLPARGRREDVEDEAQPDRAGRPRRRVRRRRRSATTSSRDQRFGPDGDFSYEAMVARYNADLANNFGNLANRVLNMAVNYCGGVVPDARDDGPLVARGRAGVRRAHRARSTRLDFAGGFGAVWELIRATNAYIEDRQPWALNKAGDAATAAAVLGDCLEVLRVVALLASPVIPQRRGRALAPARAARQPRGPAPPRGRGVGSAPRRVVAREGRAALPPDRSFVTGHAPDPGRAPVLRWVDSHCHLTVRSTTAPTRRSAAPAAGGGREWSAWAPTWRRRRPPSTSPLVSPTCGPPSGSIPTTPPGSPPSGTRSRRWPPRPGWWASARPGSTSTTTTRRRRTRRPRSAGTSTSRTGWRSRW